MYIRKHKHDLIEIKLNQKKNVIFQEKKSLYDF